MTETSISAAVEGASVVDSSKGGILTKISLMVIILFVTVVKAKKWFYPYTLEDLKDQIDFLDKYIKGNTALGRNLFGDFGREFRERLRR